MESTSWSYSLLGILANRHIATISGCPVCLVGCEDIMHTLFYLLSCKIFLGKTRVVQLIMKEAVNLDRAGAVALEHTIFTKGAWDPLGGIGLP
jgi:hypothetical protein